MEHVNDIDIQWIDFKDENQAIKAIDEILSFIQKYYELLRVNTVSFYSEDQWEVFRNFSLELSQEIMQLTDEEMAKFPIGDPELFTVTEYPALHDFSVCFLQKRLECLGVIRDNVFGDESGHGRGYFDMSQSGKHLLKNFMAPKKTHEVLNMACFVNGICKIVDIHQVVDIGSGKGYLSYFLSKYYNLDVIGVDSSCINTAGASKRNFILDKQWRGLVKSAIRRSNDCGQNDDRTKRGVSDVVEDEEKRDGAGQDNNHQTKALSSDMHESTSEQTNTDKICKDKKDMRKGRKQKKSASSNFQPITAYVNQQTDFSQFFDTDKGLCLVGLHACGNLSPSMLRIFTASDQMKILCNVACCYHLLTEECSEMSPEIQKMEEEKKQEEKKEDRRKLELLKKDEERRELTNVSTGVNQLLVKDGKEDVVCIDKKEVIEKLTLEKICQEVENTNNAPPVSRSVNSTTSCASDTFDCENKHVCFHQPMSSSSQNPSCSIGTITRPIGTYLQDPKSVLQHQKGSKDSKDHATAACSKDTGLQIPEDSSIQENSDKDNNESAHLQQPASSTTNPHTNETDRGFPISRYLRAKNAQLNKNARMVGCMAVQRVHQAKELPTEKLFYRAVFQSILIDNFKDYNNCRNVGKLAGKCKNFVEYCRRAFQKLDLDGSKLTDDQLLQYYNKYNPDKRKLQAFNQFRSALAPSIEGLILLDRLLYLKEQKQTSLAYIVKLFNQVISPRCYAIVAVKD
ncbi:probable methyltransferase-like protein 25 [Antedon mediterranea]|uniref:probable methyltransferase-like protein 25 n=1 Tax=Antedon mediterranea TaxID=105859 RepID=UPI003AF44E45